MSSRMSGNSERVTDTTNSCALSTALRASWMDLVLGIKSSARSCSRAVRPRLRATSRGKLPSFTKCSEKRPRSPAWPLGGEMSLAIKPARAACMAE